MVISALFSADRVPELDELDIDASDNQDLSVQLTALVPESIDSDDFKLVCKRWRQVSRQWICNNPSLLKDLLFVRLSLTPLVSLMASQLLGIS